MPVTIRPILNVAEIPPIRRRMRAHLPSLRSLIADSADEHEGELFDYLSQGVWIVYSMCGRLGYDLVECPFEAARDQSDLVRIPDINLSIGRHDGSTRIHHDVVYTDGNWFWYGVCLHYLRKYHVRLDPEFCQHAKSRSWRIDVSTINPHDLDNSILNQCI